MNLSRLVTVDRLGELHPETFPATTVRSWLARNYRRFRERCSVLAGGRILIDLEALESWLEDGRGMTPTPKRESVTPPKRLSFDERNPPRDRRRADSGAPQRDP